MKTNPRFDDIYPFRRRSALTLIEVMIATTITLLMLLALAKGFKALSETVSEGRSKLTLSAQLRGLSKLLRSDLEGCTTTSDTPQSVLSATGYFKYYDGPISDATATLFNHLPGLATVENRVSASRWGDIDDILMFTAKAKPGQVFRGKVPWALLIIDKMNYEREESPSPNPSWNPTATNVPGWISWADAWSKDVTISSEYAEIVWFMMPLNEFNTIDPSNPDNMVIDVAPGVDLDGDGVPDPDGMPDRLALCRRVLLIRPDLNISAPSSMFRSNEVAAGNYLSMQPIVPVIANPNTFRFMMQYPYQRCDLSVRPNAITDSGNTYYTISSNSIEDLQLPENRFAHYGFPIGTLGTTLPQLALSTEFPSTIVPTSKSDAYLAMTNPTFENLGLTINATNATLRDRGFMPSCFMRTKPTLNGPVPLLEEIVASNVVGFDLKGFDTSVKQLSHPGADGVWGNDGTPAQAGWPGTDDLSLTPSDPGYALQLDLINSSYPSIPNVYERQSGSGAFVDAGWGSKVVNSTHRRTGPNIRLSTANNLAGVTKYFVSSLSLLDLDPNPLIVGKLVRASSLAESGMFINPALHQSYQPAFDTFTNSYEFDGEALLNPRGIAPGLIWVGGLRRFNLISGPVANADPGSDVSGNGSPDASPQIQYKLPSIQATIRVQDYTAGTLQQISVVHDLTN